MLINILRYLKIKLRFLQYYNKYYAPISIQSRFWCLLNGFFPKNYVLYNFPFNDATLYVSDYQENFQVSRINKNPKLINNKVLFTESMMEKVEMPMILGLVEKGTFVSYGKSSPSDLEGLLLYVKNTGGVIFKPIDGDGGLGILKLIFEKGSFQISEKNFSREEVLERVAKLNHHLISPLIEQHPYAQSLYPYSINTIRILVFKDPSNQQYFIADAAQRIGNDRSRPVDNCGMGGFTSKIDIETGTIGQAVQTYFEERKPTWHKFHPDTEAQIEGTRIPYWDQIKYQVLALSDKYSFMDYIGWDVVLQPNGKITVLEANDACDLKLHQVHQPLLSNPAVARFYKFHEII